MLKDRAGNPFWGFTLQGSQVRNLYCPPKFGVLQKVRKSLILRAFFSPVGQGPSRKVPPVPVENAPFGVSAPWPVAVL